MRSVAALRVVRRGWDLVHPHKLLLIACLAPLWLGACQDMVPEASVPARMAPGVPIAVETLEGAPAEVQSAFTADFTKAAADHQVTVLDDAQAARYRLRGYLTAYPADDGKTVLAYVWDVFDGANRRAQRVTGVEVVAGAPSDPWSLIDDRTLQRVASKSMDGIADFLADAGTAPPPMVTAKLSPRAVTGGAAAGAAAGAGADGKPLGFAPTE